MTSVHKKNSLFFKFLLSYIIILIFPATNMFILNNQYINELQEEIIANNANTLNRVMYVIDSNVKQLDSIKNHVLMNTKLNPYYSLDTPDLGMDTKEELGKYLASNPFICDIAIYFRGDTYIYTSSSSYTLPLFINNAFNYRNWNEEDFSREINTVKTPVARAAEEVTQYNNHTLNLVTFIHPTTRAESNPTTTLLFFVREDYFTRIIKDHFGEYNASIMILDQNNQVITVSNNMFALPDEIKQYLYGHDDRYGKVISIDKEKYVFSFLRSTETNWKYISFTPIQQAFGKLNAIQFRFFLVMILILLLGFAAIYYSMKTNYKPIRNLKNYANNVWKHNNKMGNEIDIVRGAMEYLTNQNEKLILDNKAASKDFILENLLKGRISTLEDFNNQGEPFGISFNNQPYLVAIILFHPTDSSKLHEVSDLCSKLESMLTLFFNGYVRDCMDQDKFVLIISMDKDSISIKDCNKRLHLFQMHLDKSIQTKTTIGIGNICDDLKNIPLSYLEASVALDYRLIKGVGSIIYYSDIQYQEDYLDSIPYKELDSLNYLIKQGNASDIEYAVDSIIGYVRNCNLPLFVARGLCFDLVNITWRSFSEIYKEILLPNIDYPNVSMLANYETIDDLTNIVKNVCRNICSVIRESTSAKNQSLISDIAAYVQNHYLSYNFSVQNMADHFGLTLTNLSQYFKNQTGHTIIDYTTNLRIEKAKELILSSELTINEICTEVGYQNTSSFIRRFKQSTGLTPGQYVKEKRQPPETIKKH